MKSLKKTLVLLVVLSMILSAVSPVFAFNDVIDEDYAEQANKMAAFGVFTGDANGNFNAEENITRAEMAVVIGRLMGLTTNEANANQGYASNFSDVAAGDWYTGWVNLVAGRGIISGFPDGTFRPNEKVTQAQAVTMIVKALGWGVVVDQTGTWPANYITKASELRLFKDAVDTNSELVTRGNVAIYCYNALTAKMWDVTESTNGELTSSRTEDTILAKYFADFTNKAGKMKLVEDVTVELSGAVSTQLGANQVKLYATDIADFINAEKAPKRDYEDATYYVTTSGVKDEDRVIAYVPAEVANIASLTGKKVDVIFGEDNEVAYLVVTDDSYEDQFVTAFDNAEREIEIDGEVYDLADTVTVKVFGYTYAEDKKDSDLSDNAIITLLTASTGLNITNPKKSVTRNVVADFILNADDEIETIDFQFSVNGYSLTLANSKTIAFKEFIVEKVSAKNALTVAGNSTKTDLDDYEDLEPRVIKNGEVAEVADITVGDVVTEVIYDSNVTLMLVTSNTVEGAVEDLDKNAFSIDGTEYKVIAQPHYNEEGEVDEFVEKSTAATLYTAFEDETVTAYLNVVGEIVAMVGESEATGTVLGIITKNGVADEDSDDVEYIKVKILAEDGSNRYYKIYNKKSGKNVTDAEYDSDVQYKPADKLAEGHFTAGKLVRFEADSDKVIKSNAIEFIADGKTYNFKSEDEVVAKKLTVTNKDVDLDNDPSTDAVNVGEVTISVVSDDKKLEGKRYNSSTVVINPAEEELITNWDVLTRSENAFAYVNASTEAWIFTKGTKVVYVIASIDEDNYGASDAQYGILLDTRKDKDEDDETIYIATVLVDGKEVEYECDSDVRAYDEGCFVSFKVTDGEFKANPTELISIEMVDYVENATSDDAQMADFATYLKTAYTNDANVKASFKTFATTTAFKEIKVKEVETVDGDTYLVFEDNTTVDLADDYIVYSLEDSEEIDTINEGDYVLVVDYDDDDKAFNIVIVL